MIRFPVFFGFKENFNQQDLGALVPVENLNASTESSASSAKKIYTRQWRERK